MWRHRLRAQAAAGGVGELRCRSGSQRQARPLSCSVLSASCVACHCSWSRDAFPESVMRWSSAVAGEELFLRDFECAPRNCVLSYSRTCHWGCDGSPCPLLSLHSSGPRLHGQVLVKDQSKGKWVVEKRKYWHIHIFCVSLHLVKWVQVTQSCPILCDPVDYTVHGILQARILEWVAFPFFRGSFQPRDWTQVSRIAGRFFYQLSHKGSPRILEWVAYSFSSGSPRPRIWTGVSFTAGGFFTNWAMREALSLHLVVKYSCGYFDIKFSLIYLINLCKCRVE